MLTEDRREFGLRREGQPSARRVRRYPATRASEYGLIMSGEPDQDASQLLHQAGASVDVTATGIPLASEFFGPEHGGLATRLRSFSGRLNWGFWILLIVLIGAWQILGSRHNLQPFIVAPTIIIRQFGTLWAAGTLLEDLSTSAQEFAIGFAIGAVVGVAAGILGGNWRAFERSLTPIVSAVYAIPILALAPIFILVFGIGILSKVVVVAMETFFPVYLTTSAGVAATELSFRELGRAFNLSPRRMITLIIVPSALPYIASSLRVAVGRAITSVMAGEIFGARAGVGLLILNASSQFQTPSLYVGIVIFAVSGIVLTRFFAFIEKKMSPWKGVGAA